MNKPKQRKKKRNGKAHNKAMAYFSFCFFLGGWISVPFPLLGWSSPLWNNAVTSRFFFHASLSFYPHHTQRNPDELLVINESKAYSYTYTNIHTKAHPQAPANQQEPTLSNITRPAFKTISTRRCRTPQTSLNFHFSHHHIWPPLPPLSNNSSNKTRAPPPP